MAVDLLEEQRRLIEEAIGRVGGFYGQQQPQDLLGMFMSQARGEAVPFTDQVRQGMLGQNADAGAGQFAGNRQLVQRAMANAGLTGSGLEASALMSAQRNAQQALRAGRREINTRAELENFAARERGQQAAMSFLAQQEAANRAAAAAEVSYRSQMHATGDATNVTNAAPGPGGGAQPTNPSPAAPAQAAAPTPVTPARPTRYGLSNSLLQMPYGGSAQYQTGYAPTAFALSQAQGAYKNDMARYQEQVRKQQEDRAYLAQLQADWDSQYGGRGF